MFIYGLSRKQCGVIFANVKSGKLHLVDDFTRWMYDHIADNRIYADNAQMADVFNRMRSGLDAIFAGDLEKAATDLSAAYNTYHIYYKEG